MTQEEGGKSVIKVSDHLSENMDPLSKGDILIFFFYEDDGEEESLFLH